MKNKKRQYVIILSLGLCLMGLVSATWLIKASNLHAADSVVKKQTKAELADTFSAPIAGPLNLQAKSTPGNLPDLPGPVQWRNSFTDLIPRADAISLTHSAKTEVVDSYNMGPGHTATTSAGTQFVYPFQTGPSKSDFYLVLSNIGFYNGVPLYVKVNVTTPNGYMTHVQGGDEFGITTSETNFLEIYGGVTFTQNVGQPGERLRVNYQFFTTYDKDDPTKNVQVKPEGYLNFGNVTKNIQFQTDQISAIYSMPKTINPGTYGVDAGFTQPVQIEMNGEYTGTNNSQLLIRGMRDGITFNQRLQTQLTVLYQKGLDSWQWSDYIDSLSGSAPMKWVPNNLTPAKIQIPNPQEDADGWVINEIGYRNATKAADPEEDDGSSYAYDAIPLQFVQQIPYEMKVAETKPAGGKTNPNDDSYKDFLPAINNYNQQMTWQVTDFETEDKNNIVTVTDASNAFKVENDDGETVGGYSKTAPEETADVYFKRAVDPLQQATATFTTTGSQAQSLGLSFPGGGTIQAPQNPDVYNHFYTFQNFVKINFTNDGVIPEAEQINSEDLQKREDDVSYPTYLKMTSKASLAVKNQTGVSGDENNPLEYGTEANEPIDMTTWLNFGANVQYAIQPPEYLEENGGRLPTYTFDTNYKKDEATVAVTYPDPDDSDADPDSDDSDAESSFSVKPSEQFDEFPPLLTHKVPELKKGNSITDALSSSWPEHALLITTEAEYGTGDDDVPTFELGKPDVLFPPVSFDNDVNHQLQATNNNKVTYYYTQWYSCNVEVGTNVNGTFTKIPFDPKDDSPEYISYWRMGDDVTTVPKENPTEGEDAVFAFPDETFFIGEPYISNIRQTNSVNEGYAKPEDPTPYFYIDAEKNLVVDDETIELKGDKATYTDADYNIIWNPDEWSLTVQIINQPIGDVGIVSADDIDFGEVTIPDLKTITKVPEKIADQYPSLTIADTRPDLFRNGWSVTAKMTKPFTLDTDSSKTIQADILYYKNEQGDELSLKSDGSSAIPLLTKEKEEDNSGETVIALGDAMTPGGEVNKGFYLDIPIEKQISILSGSYTADLTYTLSATPFDNP